MSRYIDADALIQLGLQDGAYEYVSVQEIADFPTADVRENVRGEWIDKGEDYMIRWTCSNCGRRDTHIYDFCPNCGADMRGERKILPKD